MSHATHSVQKMEEMRGIIEDLEALKELNDELEETHVETEKQLLEEIGDSICRHCLLSNGRLKLSPQMQRIYKHLTSNVKLTCLKKACIITKRRSANFGIWSPLYKGRSKRSCLLSLPLSRVILLLNTFCSDIDHLREQQTVAEFDAKNLNSQTQGMLDLNLKLQSTVAKAQIKSLDLELRKMEKRHAVEQLSVVKVRLLSSPCSEREALTVCLVDANLM